MFSLLFYLATTSSDSPAGNSIILASTRLKPACLRQEAISPFSKQRPRPPFSRALEIVFSGETKPRTLLDIGGNTGKWSLRCAEHDKDVRITVVDLPEQVSVADQNVRDAGQSDRIDFFPVDLLDDASSLPENRDAAWMSQFLCCFSESQIVSILTRTRKALNPDGRVFILDTFWDHQRLEVSAYCLIMTSLYFTCLANGNSRMYDSKTMLRLIDQAGLELVSEHRDLGISHSLLVCKKKSK